MAGVTITLDVLGQERVSKALNRLLRAGANPDDALRDMGEYLLNAHRQRWAQQQAPDGTPWEPLSEQYAARKRAKRPAAGILVFDDVLRGTLRYQVSGHTLALGTDRPYGATHQFGRDFGRGAPIPARPWLGISKQDEDVLREHLAKALGRA